MGWLAGVDWLVLLDLCGISLGGVVLALGCFDGLRFGVVLCCVWCIDVRVWWYDVFAATLVGNRLVLWVSGVLFVWVGFK